MLPKDYSVKNTTELEKRLEKINQSLTWSAHRDQPSFVGRLWSKMTGTTMPLHEIRHTLTANAQLLNLPTDTVYSTLDKLKLKIQSTYADSKERQDLLKKINQIMDFYKTARDRTPRDILSEAIRHSAPKPVKGSEVENWDRDFETNIDDKWRVETPPDTPLSDLIILKDSYSGPMPLNAIKESDFKATLQLLEKISKGETPLEITENDEFKKNCQAAFEKICQREAGRQLLKDVFLNNQEPITIMEGIPSAGYSAKGTKNVHMNFSSHDFVFTEDPGTGRRILAPIPYEVILAHELMHISHMLKGSFEIEKADSPPTIDQDFHTLEEQVTITGLYENIRAPVRPDSMGIDKDARDKLFDQAAKELEDIERNFPNSKYNSINETRLSTALGESWRMDHISYDFDRFPLETITPLSHNFLMEIYTKRKLDLSKAAQFALRNALSDYFTSVSNNPPDASANLRFAIELQDEKFIDQLFAAGATISIQAFEHYKNLLKDVSPKYEEVLKTQVLSTVKQWLWGGFSSQKPSPNEAMVGISLCILFGEINLADSLWYSFAARPKVITDFLNAYPSEAPQLLKKIDPAILRFYVSYDPNLKIFATFIHTNDFAALEEYLISVRPTEFNKLVTALIANCPADSLQKLNETAAKVSVKRNIPLKPDSF